MSSFVGLECEQCGKIKLAAATTGWYRLDLWERDTSWTIGQRGLTIVCSAVDLCSVECLENYLTGLI